MGLDSGFLFRLAGVLITAGCFLLILHIVNIFFRRILRKKDSIVMKFLHSAVEIVLISIMIYSILAQFDITREISTVVLQSGTLIIAVLTFAAQQALGNIISGLSISAFHPLDIGQKVKIVSGGAVLAEGIVRDMTVRHVVIEQYDGQSCIIPNGVVDQSVIVNVNYSDDVGNFLNFEVGYGTDLDLARSIIYEELQYEPLVIRKDVMISTSSVSANGLVLRFLVWTKTLDENFLACSHLRERIVKKFMEKGIEIPFNTVDVNIRR